MSDRELIRRLPTPTVPMAPFPIPTSAKSLAKRISQDEGFKNELEEIISNFWMEVVKLTMKKFNVNAKTAIYGLIPILGELQAKFMAKAVEGSIEKND
jgi:hypothetical protein